MVPLAKDLKHVDISWCRSQCKAAKTGISQSEHVTQRRCTGSALPLRVAEQQINDAWGAGQRDRHSSRLR